MGWFAVGVVFEQCWAGSSTNTPPKVRVQGNSGASLGFSLNVLILAVACFALPVSWAFGATGAILFIAFLWPVKRCPSNEKRCPKTPPGAWKNVSWEEATKDCPCTGESYLVIGTGFVGMQLVNSLLQRGEKRVCAFDVNARNPFSADRRVTYIVGNVLSKDDLAKACEGVDTVYATFAVIRFWESMHSQAPVSIKINIEGTRNVIEACKKCGVKRLIQTSSSNVCVSPKVARLDMDEDAPYVPRDAAHNHYVWTKAIAEQDVRAAHSDSGLHTLSVRPCSGVFGARDSHLTERMMNWGYIVCPSPSVTQDYVFVDNVVLGHLKAEARLREDPHYVGGHVFNISNWEPVNFWSLISALSTYHGGLRQFPAPALLIYVLSNIMEVVRWVTGDRVVRFLHNDINVLTPATLATANMSFTVKGGENCKAYKMLNYRPAYTFDEAVQKTVHEWKVMHGIEVS